LWQPININHSVLRIYYIFWMTAINIPTYQLSISGVVPATGRPDVK